MHIYLDFFKLFWQIRLPPHKAARKSKKCKDPDQLSHGNDHHISAQQHFLNGTFSDWTASYLALDFFFFRLFNVIIPQIYHQSYLKTSYFSKYKWLIPFPLRQDPETLSINFLLSHCLVSPSSISSYSYAWKHSAIIKHTDSCGSLYFQKKPEGELFSRLRKFDDQTVRLQFTAWQRLLERQAEIRPRMTQAKKLTAHSWAGNHCGVSHGNCWVGKWKKYSIWDYGYRWDNNVAVYTLWLGAVGEI